MFQALDENIVLFFQAIRCEALTAFFKLFIPLEIWLWIALGVVLYFFFRTKLLRAPVLSFFLARNLSFYWFNVAKDFFHRPRPYITIPHAVPVMTVHGFSFPSGHSTLAMASAVVLAHHFPKSRPWVYTLAALTGLSRIYWGVHYLSDVLAGFVLGAILAGLSILAEQGILALTKGVRLGNTQAAMVILSMALLVPNLCQAKGSEQDQIILLNDCAAALEDTNPAISKSLTALADEKDKEWQARGGNSGTPAKIAGDPNDPKIENEMHLLNDAAQALKAVYPLIAGELDKMSEGLALQGITTGMQEGDFLNIYPQQNLRTFRHSGTDDWLSYNVPLDDPFDKVVTFHFENNQLTEWTFNDRPEVVKEYLSEFSFYQDPDLIGQAIKKVLEKMPYQDFLSVTRRQRPVLFTEFYDSGTARFASSSEFIVNKGDPPCCSEGFTIVKLGMGLGLAKTPGPIEGVVAHEIAHRVLDSIKNGNVNCNAERRANALIKQWGFKEEFKEASELFGQKKGDPAGCQETPDKTK